MKAKTKFWMAKSANGALHPFTASTSRELCRGRYLSMFMDRPWKWLYRHGHRIVRVKATEL